MVESMMMNGDPSARVIVLVSLIIPIVLLLFTIRVIIEQWKRIKILRDAQNTDIQGLLRQVVVKQVERDIDMTRLIEQQELLMNQYVCSEGIDRRVLAVCINSKDKALTNDLVAIRQSWDVGDYIRVMPLTQQSFINAIMRQRKDTRRGSDRKVRYIHIAVYCGADGLLFEDGLVTAEFLSRYIDDVECLFINGCNGDIVGSYLTGLADYVVALAEEVEHGDATNFARHFWAAVKHGESITQAYYMAIDASPRHVAEFARLL